MKLIRYSHLEHFRADRFQFEIRAPVLVSVINLVVRMAE